LTLRPDNSIELMPMGRPAGRSPFSPTAKPICYPGGDARAGIVCNAIQQVSPKV
jgi:hypothetical protein